MSCSGIQSQTTTFLWEHKKKSAGVGLLAITLIGLTIRHARRRLPPSLKVTSYNTLCPTYGQGEWYAHLDPSILTWENRQRATIEKILSTQSDIICLQEVEPTFFATLQRELADYTGLYTQKLNRPDGVAMFYRTKRLNLVERTDFFFEQSSEVANFPWRPAQFAEFDLNGTRFGVINTHLGWTADGELAFAQARELVRDIVDPYPLDQWIICGDFNVEITSKAVEELQNYGLRYAYAGVEQNTCSVPNFVGKVDYIFHNGLRAEPLPIETLLDPSVLPSVTQPSDHIAITADLWMAP